MAPDVMKRAFEPFFTTREQGEGTGMGLAVVYGIVNGLNGAITVESEVGTGTIFRVLLPKVKADVKEDDIRPPHISTGIETILFVDDEEMLAEWAKAILEKLGYSVVSVTDPAKALRTFSSDPGRFDIVITDQSMPTMTGLELAQKLRAIRPDIPVILCTGHDMTTPSKMTQTAGIKNILIKPISRQELATVIRHVLDKTPE